MSEEQIGARKGDYEILGVLGFGGMGKVYKVRNVLSDRVEAMKVLLPNLADQKDLADRFLREIKVLASLSHPNIASLRTALTIDNQLVMIMEYVEGTTLSARVEQSAIPCADALNYVSQVLDALSYAHHRQVIHRDIKPANMMLTPEGVVKLMDFGIARSGPDLGLTVTGMTLGSLSYMSPEQVKCETIDARSDLYSVGVSLYEMVTGRRPFQSESNFETMQAHLQDPPKPPIELKPDLPMAVSTIILMAMEKDPARRFQSADAFRNALQSAAADVGAPVTGAVSGPPAIPESEKALPSAAAIPGPQPGGSRVSRGLPPSESASLPPPRVNGSGHRGLYITLGALIVAAILVAAGFTVPRWLKTRASEGASLQSSNSSLGQSGTGAASSVPTNPGSAPATSSSAVVQSPANPPQADPTAAVPGAVQESPAAAPNSTSMTKSGRTGTQSSGQGNQQAVSTGATSGNNNDGQPPPPDPAQVAEIEHQSDQLSSREAAVNASLENLQRQMSAQGLGLRGDMVAAQQRMQTYMSKAQAAVQAQDVPNARKYLDLAEPEVEKLEKFLGR